MFQKWFRQQGFFRKSVDDGTRDAILDAERARVAAWVAKRMFPPSIEVDDGCDGIVPEGVKIIVRVAGVQRSKLAPLLDDIDLDGSLRSLFVDPENVQLVFTPLRATEVYDIALRRLDELLAEPDQVAGTTRGPYR